MIFSNKTSDDILVREQLDKFSEINPHHFKLYHTLTRHDDAKHGEFRGLKGRVSAELFKTCGLPEPSPETLICYCGPAAFNKTVVETLTAMGYTEDMLFKF